MPNLTVCILTFNSIRTIERCLIPALLVADEVVVVDSGSKDGTLDFLSQHSLSAVHRPYDTHAKQMNYAIGLAANDWVLCLDSDEFMDETTVWNIHSLKMNLPDEKTAFRISRHWHVLGREVHAIYPVSSPDYPVRMFNRRTTQFNDQPVDDKPIGFAETRVIAGRVTHDTFFSLDDVFSKVNSYTTRLVSNKPINSSLLKVFVSPAMAFLKWYLRKGAWKDGTRGVVTGGYAALYTFLKYLKAWGKENHLPLK
jgi:glycosyltransferase involved in cell wall biosynthesis